MRDKIKVYLKYLGSKQTVKINFPTTPYQYVIQVFWSVLIKETNETVFIVYKANKFIKVIIYVSDTSFSETVEVKGRNITCSGVTTGTKYTQQMYTCDDIR